MGENLLNNLANWWPLILGLISGLGILYRFLNKKFKDILDKSLHGIVESEIKPIAVQVDKVEEQFRNNGGGSMKDAVDRVEVELGDAKQKVVVATETLATTTQHMALVSAQREQEMKDMNAKVDASSEMLAEMSMSRKADMDEVYTKLAAGQENLSMKLDEQAVKLDSQAAKLDNVADRVTANNAKISAITANLKAAYFEFGPDGKLTTFNDAFLALLDITYRDVKEATAVGTLSKFVYKDDRTKLERSGNAALQAKGEWVADFRVVRSDGKLIPVTVRAFPVWDGEEFGGYVGALVEVPDATELQA